MKNYVKNLIIYYKNKFNFKNYLISLSGGVDSTVLLYLINDISKEIDINVRSIHINHNLNNKSKIYENYSKIICYKLNIKLFINNIFLKKKLIKKFGLEYYCRILRYNSIKKIIKKNEILLTAHNKNDNVETLIIFLSRGCGINGLSSIKEFNNVSNVKILRPLLNFKKKDILNYSINNNIKFVQDNTNFDYNICYRNFIRNKVIPIIEYKCNNFIDISSRSIKIYNDQYEILEKYIKNDIKSILKGELLNFYDLKKKYNNESHIKLIIQIWLTKILKINIISYKILNSVYKNILFSKKDSKPIVKVSNKKYLTKFRNFLYCINKPKKIDKNIIEWNNYNKLYLPNKIGILKKDYNLKDINKNKYIYIKIRKNYINEKITINLNSLSYNKKVKLKIFKYKKKIKNLFKLFEIPFWIRNQIPFIFYNEELISAICIFITEKGEISNKDKNHFIYIKWFNSPIKKYINLNKINKSNEI